MSCERFREAITEHGCGAPIRGAAAAHLAACEPCRRRLVALQQNLGEAEKDLRDSLMLTASPGFAAGVSARVQQIDATPSYWALPTRWWMGAAVAAVLVFGLFLGWPAERQGTTATSEPLLAPVVSSATDAHAAVVGDASLQPPKKPAISEKWRAPRRTPASRTTASTKTLESEVIVPPDQQRAIARLRELLRTGQLDGGILPEPRMSAELIIEPLAIPELHRPELPGAEYRE